MKSLRFVWNYGIRMEGNPSKKPVVHGIKIIGSLYNKRKIMALKKVFQLRDLFDRMNYPAGEPHIRLKATVLGELQNGWYRPFIIVEARNWNELMEVHIGHQILRDNGINATFVIPYLPFSRHDRKNDHLDSMPIRFVLEMLKDIHVVTIDPHSDVSGVIPNYSQKEVVKLYEKNNLFHEDSVVIIPDAGAIKKTHTWLGERVHVQCLKIRNPKTGKLSGFQIINPELVTDQDVVIIDDICDAGGTFLGLADELEKAGVASIRLAVTHGLFTKGIDILSSRFEAIYTLDCGSYRDDPRLVVISTEELIREGTYF